MAAPRLYCCCLESEEPDLGREPDSLTWAVLVSLEPDPEEGSEGMLDVTATDAAAVAATAAAAAVADACVRSKDDPRDIDEPKERSPNSAGRSSCLSVGELG